MTDQELMRGALGGWIYRTEAKLLSVNKQKSGRTRMVVWFDIPADSVKKAEHDKANGLGGWIGVTPTPTRAKPRTSESPSTKKPG